MMILRAIYFPCDAVAIPSRCAREGKGGVSGSLSLSFFVQSWL
jgi:hypothetical protein